MDRSQIKLVYITPRFHPFKGGAEQNTYQLATRSAAAGYDVTVLTTDMAPDNNPLPKEEIHRGVKIVRLHRWNQQLNLGFYPALFWKLLKTNATVIHVGNGPGYMWQEICLIFKRIFSRKTKFIITPHGPFLAARGRSSLKNHMRNFARFLMETYCKIIWPLLFDTVIQVNPKQAEWLRRDYNISARKLKLLPNGIDDRLIVPSKDSSDLAGQPVVITYVGRLMLYKGVQQVIKALAEVREQINDKGKLFKFIAMGKAVDLEKLENIRQHYKLEDVVEFIEDPTDNQRDTILYSRSQIHILPSQWEATGIVLLEAMAKGNAIITTTGNEAAELLIDEGENGYIYEYDSIEKLSTVLRVLIQDANLRQRMIDLNLKKVKDFTWESIYPTYESILVSLL
jgi:glycosyltransferase involved in cell wall biosynthesis